ncbi:branched-chain amino acid ABC transporter substrate-binding protein [Nakamurella flava]|uniref:Branched-chain amino acid ABC transporter substrate-binding protein n=2 Tax=Nakamurella flava TaxID=2576308 RepID=A0A4U6QJX3_9ACTN|nr:branched-chain amino acid ABC transporter substrate-binding protein [Nakamurella flava]
MHRRSMRTAVVGLAAVAALTLAACGSKSTDSGSTTSAGGGGASNSASPSGSTAAGSGGALAINPEVQIDIDGKEVPAATGTTAESSAKPGGVTCAPGTAIAMAGALTGANAALGLNILYGAKVALDEHNKANPNCQVEIKQFDTEGDPQKATQVAPQIVGDSSVIGLLGPAFSGETKATGPIFNQAGLLSLTASATNPALTTNGWTNFFRGLANDAVQGPAVAKYMVNTLGYKKVCVVQDNSDYGAGLAEEIKTGLGSVADTSCAAEVKTGDKDFTATVQLVNGAAPDAVFYAGYYAEAAPFVQQLRDAGVTATFVSADGTNDPQFVSQAGGAAKDAILSCPCGPAPEEFAKTYEALNGQAPGVYSTEGYDLTTIMLKGIDSGVKDRAGLVEYVKGYSGQGLAREYKWDDKGELASSLVWIYKVG